MNELMRFRRSILNQPRLGSIAGIKPLSMKQQLFASLFFLSFCPVILSAQSPESTKDSVQSLRKQRKYAEALDLTNKYIVKHPKDSSLILLKANVLVDLGQYEEALRIFDGYLEKYPEDASALYYRAICRVRLGHEKSALADLDLSIRIDPGNADVFYYRGNLKNSQENLAGAASDYLSAVNLDSTYYLACFRLASLYYRQKKFDSALVYYDKELRLRPAHKEAIYQRSYCRLMVKNFQGSLEDVKKLAEFGIEDELLCWNGGISSMNLKLFKEAEKFFDRYIAFDSTVSEVFYRRSIVRDSLEDLDGALSDLDHCIALNPNEAKYYLERGYLKLIRQMNFRAGLKDYDKAIELAPEFASAYYYRALLYGQIYKDADKACDDMKKAKQLGYDIDPEDISRFCK